MTVPTDRHEGADPGVERYLRDAFARDAGGAPLPDDLAGEARRIGHAHRRRTAVVSATLSVVLVAAGVAVAQRVTADARPAPVPATQGDGTPGPGDPALGDSEPALMFRGVEVPVPAEMLDPSAYRCGTAVKDAAYVVDDALAIASCLATPPHPEELTEVVLQPVSTVTAAERVAGATVLPDGRTRVASAVPRGDVWVSVTSPDADLAHELFNGVRLPDRVNGCPIQPAPVPEAWQPSYIENHLDQFQSGAHTGGGVCGYREKWLVGATWLQPDEVAELTALIEEAPSGATVDCFGGEVNPEGSGWWVTLPGERIYFDARFVCPTFHGDVPNREGVLTDSLVSLLWSLAPGPASLEGVYSDK